MEFYAYHGCMEHEKKLGNTFFVTVEMTLDTKPAGDSDNLNDTLNYQRVYDIVKEQINIPSNLIEHVGQRIINNLVKTFPQVSFFTIKLSKLNPPLGGKTERVSIELTSSDV